MDPRLWRHFDSRMHYGIALTDTTPRPRRANHLLINAYDASGSPCCRHPPHRRQRLIWWTHATVGRDVSVTALATGSWDSVAKLEAILTRLEREEG